MDSYNDFPETLFMLKNNDPHKYLSERDYLVHTKLPFRNVFYISAMLRVTNFAQNVSC